jgi:primosomal protein N''
MFKIVEAQVNDYIPKLTKADFDNNLSKIEQEISNIEKKYKFDQQISTNVKFDNKKFTLDQFLKKLKQQVFDIKEKKNVGQMYDTSLFQNIGGKNVDISSDDAQEGLKRDIAALERQIQEREQTLAEIDNYIVTLLSGEMSQLNISHSNAKFVKIADRPSEDEVLGPVEDYFNELYDDTPGSPNYGKLMTHPEKHRNELSTEAQAQSSKPKFKKI